MKAQTKQGVVIMIILGVLTHYIAILSMVAVISGGLWQIWNKLTILEKKSVNCLATKKVLQTPRNKKVNS